ncbi:MAG: DUF4389 domain-containing protein [Woeseiaceae bacterium]
MTMTNEEQPRDHVPGDREFDSFADDGTVATDLEGNLKSRDTWLRLLFMIVLVLIYGLSRIVVAAVVVLQFFWVLLTGETNVRLKALGHSLATYTYQIVLYLTFNSDERPFPFDQDWPS